jgi:hypothetical protein
MLIGNILRTVLTASRQLPEIRAVVCAVLSTWCTHLTAVGISLNMNGDLSLVIRKQYRDPSPRPAAEPHPGTDI